MIAFFYDLIHTLPVCMTVILAFHESFHTEESTPSFMIATILACCFCALFYHLKSRGRILLGGILASLFLCMLFVLKWDWFSQRNWILGVILICCLGFVLEIAAGKYKMVRIATATIAFCVLIIRMIGKYETNKAVFCMLLFYLLISIAELIEIYWTKEGQIDFRKHIVHILPFFIPIFALILIVRIPEKPYDWKFFKNMINDVRTGYEAMLQTILPDQGWDVDEQMGFSDRGVINGSIQSNPYRVFTVSSDSERDYRLYLGGKTFDTFDGRQWIKTDDSSIDFQSFDRLELYHAIMQNDADHMYDYIQTARLHITYDGIRTQHLFVPPKSLPDHPIERLTQRGGDLILPGRQKAEYSVKYYRMNRDHPRFRQLLMNRHAITESEWNRAISAQKGFSAEAYNYQTYQQYRDVIYQIYLKPVTLSERAMSHLIDLFADSENDLEKLEKIEQMLSNMRYSRFPGDLPDSVDTDAAFIDYLLFELPEGFCTHFATAFVLLARSQGIPARYVQGYSVLSKARSFEVQSDRAHAWPEVYLDGIGWIAFEPTPGFKTAVSWSMDGDESLILDRNAEEESHEIEEEESNEKTEEGLVGFRTLRLPLLFIIGFLILFFLIDQGYRRFRYYRMNDREKVLALCQKNMRMLRYAGMKLQTGETLSEFTVRYDLPQALSSFIRIYEQVLYGFETSNSKEVPIMEEISKECRRFAIQTIINRIRLRKRHIGMSLD